MPNMALQKRAAHHKSRWGCRNCKNRHIKCDGNGPPCANCVARKSGSTCDLLTTSSSVLLEVSPASDLPLAGKNTLLTEKNYMLDLELLHHWTSTTYSSILCVPTDIKYLQYDLPRCGLQHDYILKGILGCAAVEKALGDTNTPDFYRRVATDYFKTAAVGYKTNLAAVTETDSDAHLLYMFTMLQMIVSFATLRFQLPLPGFSTLTYITSWFDLNFTAATISHTHYNAMLASPIGPGIVLAKAILEIVPRNDTFTVLPLDDLETIVLQTSANDLDCESENISNRVALAALRLCGGDYTLNNINHFWSAFPSLAGRRFLVDITEKEPVALLILLHWATLIHQLGKSYWWASSIGRPLALEICQILEPELLSNNISLRREWSACIKRCKGLVKQPKEIVIREWQPKTAIN